MVRKIQKIRKRGEDLFDVIKKDLNRIFNDITRNVDKQVNKTIENVLYKTKLDFKNPRLDIIQNEKYVEVNVNLPGIKKKDIILNLTKEQIEITAEHSEFKKQRKSSGYVESQQHRGFHRVISLPPDLDTDNAEAEFSDEKLMLIIPKIKKKPKAHLVIR